ncbi:MAG: hypothetical protein Q9170_003562 [Blastenia crenularia]
MVYNQVNQEPGARVPAGVQSVSQSATNDFQSGHSTGETPHEPLPAFAMGTTQQASSADSNPIQQPSSSKVEAKLEREGHLPGLSEVQHDNEKNLRQPGQEDAAGNKIHHKGILGKMLHWEHSGMNAD